MTRRIRTIKLTLDYGTKAGLGTQTIRALSERGLALHRCTPLPLFHSHGNAYTISHIVSGRSVIEMIGRHDWALATFNSLVDIIDWTLPESQLVATHDSARRLRLKVSHAFRKVRDDIP